ncbi:MAG TPA: ECF-type sigma factor [Gemmatirosa sp.]|nr:ECF-type sigma factor [Gemmatirosa sp.]
MDLRRHGRPDRCCRMHEESAHEAIPDLVEAAERGDRAALDALLPLIYDELAALARQQRRAWHGDLTLNTTALVHEAYLKVAGQRRMLPSTRAHFLAVAAKAMRHILCNHARDRRRQKRGGGVAPLRLAPGQDVAAQVELSDDQSDTLAALDEALEALQRVAARQARVVECRFFGGMGVEDTAAALDVSPRTVKRDWTFARAWLRREMQIRLDEPD